MAKTLQWQVDSVVLEGLEGLVRHRLKNGLAYRINPQPISFPPPSVTASSNAWCVGHVSKVLRS